MKLSFLAKSAFFLLSSSALAVGVAACTSDQDLGRSSSGAVGVAGGLEGTWDILTFGSETFDEPMSITIQADKVSGGNSVVGVAAVTSPTTISGSVQFDRKLKSCTFSAVNTVKRPATVTALDGDWELTLTRCELRRARTILERPYQLKIDGGTFKIYQADAPDDAYLLTVTGNTISGTGQGFAVAAHRR
jgi:hypothetical protein